MSKNEYNMKKRMNINIEENDFILFKSILKNNGMSITSFITLIVKGVISEKMNILDIVKNINKEM